MNKFREFNSKIVILLLTIPLGLAATILSMILFFVLGLLAYVVTAMFGGGNLVSAGTGTISFFSVDLHILYIIFMPISSYAAAMILTQGKASKKNQLIYTLIILFFCFLFYRWYYLTPQIYDWIFIPESRPDKSFSELLLEFPRKVKEILF